jgi:hypothetical protein
MFRKRFEAKRDANDPSNGFALHRSKRGPRRNYVAIPMGYAKAHRFDGCASIRDLSETMRTNQRKPSAGDELASSLLRFTFEVQHALACIEARFRGVVGGWRINQPRNAALPNAGDAEPARPAESSRNRFATTLLPALFPAMRPSSASA